MQLRLRRNSHVSFHLVASFLRKIWQSADKNHILIIAVLRLFNAKRPVCSILVVSVRISATKANRRNAVYLEREIFEAFSNNTNAFHWSKVQSYHWKMIPFLRRNVFYFFEFFFKFVLIALCDLQLFSIWPFLGNHIFVIRAVFLSWGLWEWEHWSICLMQHGRYLEKSQVILDLPVMSLRCT